MAKRPGQGQYCRSLVIGRRNVVMRRFISCGLLITVVFALDGCGDPARPGRTLLPLDSDVVFQFYEAYGSATDRHPRFDLVADPRVAVKMRTTKEYGCSNYAIEYTRTVSDNRVQIELLGRSIGPICLTAIGPATAVFFLDVENGDFDLVLSSDGRIATFHVTVADSSFSVSPREDMFARTDYPLYWRYPPRSFVYLCGTPTTSRSLCDDFIDELSGLIPMEEFSFPESGQGPWPYAANGYHYNAPARYFRYSDEADFQVAGAALERYAREVIGSQQGIGISLWNWRNERFLSWLFREP